MTDVEIAEKWAKQIVACRLKTVDHLTNAIVNIIAEARQDEHDRIRVQHAKDLVAACAEAVGLPAAEWYRRGFSAAKEMAQAIALGVKCELHEEEVIASRISALHPDAEKGGV